MLEIRRKEVFDLSGIKFTVGIMCHSMMPAVTAISFIDSFRVLTHSGIHLNFVSELHNSIIDSARNNVVHEFLKLADSQKLIFIDCDMTWMAEDLARLMCISTKYPIVGAMYTTKSDSPQFFGRYHYEDGLICENEYGLVKMKAIPTGFCIIDRSVFQDMMPITEKYHDNKNTDIYRFFKTTTESGKFIGEDIYFFERYTKLLGGEIWVDPDINPGHCGNKVYRGNLRESLVMLNKEGQQTAAFDK